MKRIIININWIIAIILCFNSSCTKEINVDLKNADTRMVIAGNITTDPGPYYVQLNLSNNFSKDNNFPAVIDAQVRISDDAGNSETLSNLGDGRYAAYALVGATGRTYKLEVIHGVDTYSSSSTMPLDIVNIDTMVTTKTSFGNREIILQIPFYLDPVAKINYYKFTNYVNGKLSPDLLLLDDKDNDGRYNTRPLFTSNLAIGDTLETTIESIDKDVFKYLSGLQTFSGGFNQSATPANPTSNIKGKNVLGYFSAHTASKKTIIVQPL